MASMTGGAGANDASGTSREALMNLLSRQGFGGGTCCTSNASFLFQLPSEADARTDLR